MIRRPPRSTQGVSSAASDVYKRQVHGKAISTSTQSIDIGGKLSCKHLPGSFSFGICGFRWCSGSFFTIPTQITTLPIPLLLSLIHISEPTRPLYISYAVFCLKKKKKSPQPPEAETRLSPPTPHIPFATKRDPPLQSHHHK
eukprot:TRINITY_DN31714_c0_g1_i2.p1 TRINITY_DN31714_c0_g1~~TRINITY_DN31714_c0_g1_i2.p1  ORF type:complete len:142 (+),score=25.97 TRINITY_DN31714_c0_g1_i2:110-535(+)